MTVLPDSVINTYQYFLVLNALSGLLKKVCTADSRGDF